MVGRSPRIASGVAPQAGALVGRRHVAVAGRAAGKRTQKHQQQKEGHTFRYPWRSVCCHRLCFHCRYEFFAVAVVVVVVVVVIVVVVVNVVVVVVVPMCSKQTLFEHVRKWAILSVIYGDIYFHVQHFIQKLEGLFIVKAKHAVILESLVFVQVIKNDVKHRGIV